MTRGAVIEIAHPTALPGIIVAQSPLPGQQLRSGGEVRLAVSGGLPKVQVPDVIGFEVARAIAVLEQLGLTADQETETSNRAVGTVLGISPEPGQHQPVPARVLLTVSAGPPAVAPDATTAAEPLDSTVIID